MTARQQAIPDAGVTVTELPPVGRFSLRLRPGGMAAAATVLGLALPDRVGAMASGAGRRVLCLGPDEWLLECPADDRPVLPADLPHALVDICDRETVLRIEGPRAAELLSIGIARDLRRLAPGCGCRTAFDSAQAILIREGDSAFTLAIWRSFVPHVAELLALGQRELASGF